MKLIDFEMVKQIGGGGLTPVYYYDWVDYVLRNKNEFQMPVKSRITQADGNYFAIMPAVWERKDLAMVKMIGRHKVKGNEARGNMLSDIMLYEASTGVLKAVIDGEYMTTIRTGVCAAHSALLYGRDKFESIALIGLGNIMTACVDTLLNKVNRHLILKLYKHHNQETRFIERYRNYDVEFVLCDTYDETISDADIVISAVTRATENFCSDELYKEGCTVIPIMTLGFQNCDLFFDRVFSDELEQIRGFKYFDKFKSIQNTDMVLNGKEQGRRTQTERVLVYNYGLAIMDLYFAYKFYTLSDGLEVEWNYCKERYFMG